MHAKFMLALAVTLSGSALAAQEQNPVTPLPDHIVVAWEKAGSRSGWFEKDAFGHYRFRVGGMGKSGEVPTFKFSDILPPV